MTFAWDLFFLLLLYKSGDGFEDFVQIEIDLDKHLTYKFV